MKTFQSKVDFQSPEYKLRIMCIGIGILIIAVIGITEGPEAAGGSALIIGICMLLIYFGLKRFLNPNYKPKAKKDMKK